IRLDPLDPTPNAARASVREGLGDLRGAISDLSMAVLLDPKAVKFHHNLGHAYDATGDLDPAIAEFTAGIKLDATMPQLYLGRGVSRKAKGDHDGALADFSKAVELDPKYW